MFDFKRILELHTEVRRKEGIIIRLRQRATDTTVHLTNMPKGGGDGQRMERDVIEIRAAEEDLERARAELATMKAQLRVEMKKLHKWQHRMIIKKRYLEGKRLEDVAYETNYCWSHMNRCRKEAEEIINRNTNKKRDSMG